MPRFDRLELEATQAKAAPKSAASQDERHWLKEADRQRRNGQYENALRCYSRSLEHDKNSPLAWLGQVQMLIQLDESPEADTWCRKSLELFPGNGDLLAARSQSLCRQGNAREALALSDASLAAAGQSAYRWQARGEWMLAQNQSTSGHCFEKAFQLLADWLVQVENARSHLYYKQYGKALPWGRNATERAPEEAFAWFTRGQTEIQLGMNREAQRSFDRCLEFCPGHHDAGTQLAHLRSGQFSLAGLWRRWFRN